MHAGYGGRAGRGGGCPSGSDHELVGHRHRPPPLAVGLASLSKGGHLRVGMEDVLTLAEGVPVERNDQLVGRAVELGRIVQRSPMTPGEARLLLGISLVRAARSA